MSKRLKLLIVDNDLIEFIEKHGFTKNNIVVPEELE